jgi:uncharacterized protein YecE (DUF72 family)
MRCIGTAGWSIPRASAHHFAAEGTHLQRYARVFSGVEINSSFHRPHARSTYVKWAEATPEHFRLAVKMPRSVTHDGRLVRSGEAVDRFLDETAGLGVKRGPILVQLPPSLHFESRIAGRFFDYVRKRYEGPVVCEPRHDSWDSPGANAMFVRLSVARVAADPPHAPAFARPGGWDGLVYLRLHGSPRTYWSSYPLEYLERLAATMRALNAPAWCVFDNTASGAAIENAWTLRNMLMSAVEFHDGTKGAVCR